MFCVGIFLKTEDYERGGGVIMLYSGKHGIVILVRVKKNINLLFK